MKNHKTVEKIDYNLKILGLVNFTKSNKYPLLITLVFFITLYYVSFFHHNYWIRTDGIFYLHAGEEILLGYGNNVKVANAPIGGPILYAALNSFFNDGFILLKIISLLSGTAIVLSSYYVIKNIFNSKIAIIGQLFFAFNGRLHWQSIEAMNELLPLFLTYTSLYFITKKQLKLSDIIITGSLLGISSMIRYQAIPIFFAILLFLLIHNKKICTNLSYCVFMGMFFLIAFSPMIIYNYPTHGTLLDSDANHQLLWESKFQTPEWRNEMIPLVLTGAPTNIFLDFDLFLKNYFYNLFYHNPNKLFNFNFHHDTISITPLIPFLGIIPAIGGFIYSSKIKLNKTTFKVLFGTAAISAFFVLLLGDITLHFFAIIIIPLLVLGILNIRNVEKNFLPLLVLPVVYFLVMSIIPFDRSDNLFPMWILIPTLSAVFFIEVIPKIYSKIQNHNQLSPSVILRIKIIILLLISLVLLMSLVYSYKTLEILLYNTTYGGVKDEFFKIFQKKEPLQQAGFEDKQIGDMLSKQPGIENSYVMASSSRASYYAHSKFVYSGFDEVMMNNNLDKFLTRENWTDYKVYYSNIGSIPSDRHNIYKPVPDYLIYRPTVLNNSTLWYINATQYESLKFLSDPNDPRIPSNFDVLYKSNDTGTIVYKINHKK